MKKEHFAISINAPREKVWEVLWNDNTYKKWTKPFAEGSHAVSDWKEGSEVLFLSGYGQGMFSTIAKKIPNEFMSFKHRGVLKNEKKQPEDDETKKWAGATENYTLKEQNGITELTVDMDVIEDYPQMFEESFPRALNVVKELSEN